MSHSDTPKNTETPKDPKKTPEKKNQAYSLAFKFGIPIAIFLFGSYAFYENWMRQPTLNNKIKDSEKLVSVKIDPEVQKKLELDIKEVQDKIMVNKIISQYLKEQSEQLPVLKTKFQAVTQFSPDLNSKQGLIVLLPILAAVFISIIIENAQAKKPKVLLVANAIFATLAILIGSYMINERPPTIVNTQAQINQIDISLNDLIKANNEQGQALQAELDNLFTKAQTSTQKDSTNTIETLKRKTISSTSSLEVDSIRTKFNLQVEDVLKKHGLKSQDINTALEYITKTLDDAVKNKEVFTANKANILYWEVMFFALIMIIDLALLAWGSKNMRNE